MNNMKKEVIDGITFIIAEPNAYLTQSEIEDESARSFGTQVQEIPSLPNFWRDATLEEKQAWEIAYTKSPISE